MIPADIPLKFLYNYQIVEYTAVFSFSNLHTKAEIVQSKSFHIAPVSMHMDFFLSLLPTDPDRLCIADNPILLFDILYIFH